MAQAADRIVRCAFELGGDAPFIVFADADLDAAVEGLLIAKFRNNGQSCIGANRVFVERSILAPLTERLAAATAAMTVGNPLADPVPALGPLIDEKRTMAVEALVVEALEAGARWLGACPDLPPEGSYTRPGFLLDVPPALGLATTEVFGPVSGIFAFDTEDEVVAAANATKMGLAGHAYTTDAARQWRLAEHLEVGILGINHPLPSVAFAPMVRVSDARMSGTSYGTVVLHVSPESDVGGPLALLRTGDTVVLDVAGRRLDVEVDEAELDRRRAAWTPPARPDESGYVRLYRDHVLQAHQGADFDFLVGGRGHAVGRQST